MREKPLERDGRRDRERFVFGSELRSGSALHEMLGEKCRHKDIEVRRGGTYLGGKRKSNFRVADNSNFYFTRWLKSNCLVRLRRWMILHIRLRNSFS